MHCVYRLYNPEAENMRSTILSIALFYVLCKICITVCPLSTFLGAFGSSGLWETALSITHHFALRHCLTCLSASLFVRSSSCWRPWSAELLAFHFNAANVHFTNTQRRLHITFYTWEHEMENRKQTPQTDEISSKHPCSKEEGPHTTGSNATLMFTNCLDISFSLEQEVMKGWLAHITPHSSNHPSCLHNPAPIWPPSVGKISWDNPQTESTMRGQDSSSEDYNWQICFTLTRERLGHITSYWLSLPSLQDTVDQIHSSAARLCYWHNLHSILLVWACFLNTNLNGTLASRI